MTITEGILSIVRTALEGYKVKYGVNKDITEWLKTHTSGYKTAYLGYNGIMPAGIYEDGAEMLREHLFVLYIMDKKDLSDTIDSFIDNLESGYTAHGNRVAVTNGGGNYIEFNGIEVFEYRLICTVTK